MGLTPRLSGRIGRLTDEAVTFALVFCAAAAWWLTSVTSGGRHSSGGSGFAAGDDMAMPDSMGSMSAEVFLLSWALMMAAMMLPAVTPVVALYARAAAAGRVAPTAWFVGAYLAVWSLSGLPALVLWRAVAEPLDHGEDWAVRLAAASLLLAGAYQLTPLKRACLRHCRSPMGHFMRLHGSLRRPGGAFRAGALHAGFCGGCCAGLMLVLVAAAAMSLWWALVIAAGVFVERNLSWGPRFAVAAGVVLTASGIAVLASPPLLSAALI